MKTFWLRLTSIRRWRIWFRKNEIYVYLVAGIVVGFMIGTIIANIPEPKLISPCPEMECFVPVTPKPAVKVEATTSPNQSGSPVIGKASYYSVSGCLGCSPDAIMANGQRLDDSKPTVAYNHLPLNTPVKITNLKNGKTIMVPVTDRGGFERHGKIADLSLATKNALECGDICEISLTK